MYFKTIPDYPGYICDLLGNIYSARRSIFKKKKQFPRGQGYLSVGFSKDNKIVTKASHRMILLAWSPEENFPRAQVNHKNGNKSDNRLFNLEWATSFENMHHAVKTGLLIPRDRRGEKNMCAKLDKEKVLYIRSSNETTQQLMKKFNVSSTAIYHVRSYTNWKHIE